MDNFPRGVGSNPTGTADFPSFSPFYFLSLLLTYTLHHSFSLYTRREIGSETTDNLSEDNPVKNAYALILSH